MARIAKIFQSGNSQAVRLPKDFRFEVSEVEISKEGDALILRVPGSGAPAPWSGLRAALQRGLTDDALFEASQRLSGQERADLDALFL